MNRTADAPSRSTGSFTLAWGLLNIRCSVYSGTEETRVERKEAVEVDGTYVPVGRAFVRKDDGTEIDYAQVIKIAQASNGNVVTLTDEEVTACTLERGVGTIQCLVPLTKVGTYLVNRLEQVRPFRTKGKEDPASARAYALFLACLTQRKCAALVKLATRGPARTCLLTPSGDLLTVVPADGIRASLPLPAGQPTDAEIALGLQLLDSITKGTPVVTDETAAAVRQYVDAKAAGLPAPVAAPVPDIGDMLSALQASVAAQSVA
jgi:non-homologous end joining protein Ku